MPTVYSNSSSSKSGVVLSNTLLLSGMLLSDDVTGIGVVDDGAIPIILVGGTVIAGGILLFEAHKKHKSNSNYDKHTRSRFGGDPEKGKYGQNRNDNRGNKNKKFLST